MRFRWKQMSLSVHIMSFSCSRNEKMPLYRLRQLSVMTMLRGQSTCVGAAQCTWRDSPDPAGSSRPHLKLR